MTPTLNFRRKGTLKESCPVELSSLDNQPLLANFDHPEDYPSSSNVPTGDSFDAAIGVRHDPSLALPPDQRHGLGDDAHKTELPVIYEGQKTMQDSHMNDDDFPTQEEIANLPRVAAKIPWKVYSIAFVELCERFSYYGTQILCMLATFPPLMHD